VGDGEIYGPAPEGRKKMSHTSGNILLHFIFSTQGRRPLIKSEFRGDLFAYLGGIVREMNGVALIINGGNDHVHMLIRSRPVHSASEIARTVKTNSSRWMRQKHSVDFAWQTGYGVFSVSESNVIGVSRYIAEQETHHKKRSFPEEYVAFLKKNHVEYDPKYIWD
jgi:REP element-mobilizing transposase RayT